MKNQNLNLLVLIFFLFVFADGLFACDLADHDWQSAGTLAFEIESPIFPFSEIDIATKAYTPAQVKQIIWLAKFGSIQYLGLYLRTLVKSWLTGLAWLPASTGIDITPYYYTGAQNKTVLIKSDNYNLKIAFFKDRNSDFNCRQLVILQEGRIRMLRKSADNKGNFLEFRGRSWLTVKFWQTPSLSRILTITAYPLDGHEETLYENQGLADELLAENLLKRKIESVIYTDLENLPGL
jgi:hypothetical protein